jgi:hypothetical protein
MMRSLRPLTASVAVLLITGGGLADAAGKATPTPDISGVWGGDLNAYEAKQPPAEPALKQPYQARLDVIRAQEKRMREENSVEAGSPTALKETTCLPYGMPTMMGAGYSIEILQSTQQVTVIAEVMNDVRRIYLGKPQLPMGEVPPGYDGRSVGHWEGDTLVVDTVGVKPEVLGQQQMPHSDQMRITERIRLVAPDLLADQITVHDPVALERPYTFTYRLPRERGDYETPEWVCDNLRSRVDDSGDIIFDSAGR